MTSKRCSPTWRQKAARKRQRDLAKIPKEWRLQPTIINQAKTRCNIADDFIDSLLDPQTTHITNLDLPTLMQMTRSGSLSAVELVTAFCKRAAYGHQLNDNLLEIGFQQAIEKAKSLDYHRALKQPVGPLHGLPITVKDQFYVKGMETSMAYVGWIDTFEGDKSSPCKDNVESEIIRELESLGAIVIAKSTLVQTLGAIETNNNILGYNKNPRNQLLSSGGSSGGEGAVQALRGSAIGIGSDIGGSISIPAAFNGVYSIKPSVGRLSFMSVADSSPGQSIIPTVPGIIGNSVESLEYLLKSLISTQPWLHDSDVLPLPWREQDDELNSSHLSFGLMEFDGVVRPHPPIQRALNMVAKALSTSGHEFIQWDPPAHTTALEIHNEITCANGGYDIFERLALSGEPLIPEMRSSFPDAEATTPLNAIQIEKAVIRLRAYKAEYHKYWMSTAKNTTTGRPVDAIILPVWPSAAVEPGKPAYGGYIGFANVVDHSTMVIPVTRADMHVDKLDEAYNPVGEKDREIWKSYNPKLYHGAPAAVQIQCQRLEEEKLLGIGKILTSALLKL